MAFAEIAFRIPAGDDLAGYGSVDVTEAEADHILSSVADRHGLAHPLSTPDLFMPPRHDAAIDDLLAALEGRYLAGSTCERPGRVAAASWTLAHLQMHRSKWVRRHPLLQLTCGDSEAMRALDPRYWGHAGAVVPAASADGRWEACRLAGPMVLKRFGSSALDLARFVARLAAGIAAARAVRSLDEFERAFERSLARHSSGDPDVYLSSREDRYDAWHAGPYSETVCRALDYEMTGAADDLHDGLRVAMGIDGDRLEDRRDRLLLKMLGRDVSRGRALGLRIGTLHVDPADVVHDASGGELIPVYGLDVCGSDYQALVEANGESDGYLFAAIDDRLPYGRRPLDVDDVDAILVARLLALNGRPHDGAKRPAIAV